MFVASCSFGVSMCCVQSFDARDTLLFHIYSFFSAAESTLLSRCPNIARVPRSFHVSTVQPPVVTLAHQSGSDSDWEPEIL